MSNTLRGFVDWIDGYSLRCTTNVICEVEEDRDVSLSEFVRGTLQGDSVKVREIRYLVHKMVVPPEGRGRPTVQEVGDLMDRVGLVRTTELLGQALAAAAPDGDAGPDPR